MIYLAELKIKSGLILLFVLLSLIACQKEELLSEDSSSPLYEYTNFRRLFRLYQNGGEK